jgi:hypothetical protein
MSNGEPGEGALPRTLVRVEGPLTRRFASTSPPKGEVKWCLSPATPPPLPSAP